jgi:RHS repeat-associated protein
MHSCILQKKSFISAYSNQESSKPLLQNRDLPDRQYGTFHVVYSVMVAFKNTYASRRSTPPGSRENALRRERVEKAGFRYYNPELGRWVNRDPIGEWGGLNLFSAFKNASVLRIDPLGRSCSSVASENPNDWTLEEKYKLLAMQKKKCPLPVVQCTCCPSRTKNGYYDGKFNPPVIFLCEKWFRSDNDYKRTRKHELSHAYDHCMGAKFGCTKTEGYTLICSELRAYKWANDIKDKDELIKSACSSVVAACWKSRFMIDICPVLAADIFDKCTNLDPMDPLPPFPFPPDGEVVTVQSGTYGSWNRADKSGKRGDILPGMAASCCGM